MSTLDAENSIIIQWNMQTGQDGVEVRLHCEPGFLATIERLEITRLAA